MPEPCCNGWPNNYRSSALYQSQTAGPAAIKVKRPGQLLACACAVRVGALPLTRRLSLPAGLLIPLTAFLTTG
jgi:hypothetical protein